MTKDIDDLHLWALKVRLTQRDFDLLLALAARRDVPPAVLAREILVRALEEAGYTSIGALDAPRRPA
jgi:hypothetical protein